MVGGSANPSKPFSFYAWVFPYLAGVAFFLAALTEVLVGPIQGLWLDESLQCLLLLHTHTHTHRETPGQTTPMALGRRLNILWL